MSFYDFCHAYTVFIYSISIVWFSIFRTLFYIQLHYTRNVTIQLTNLHMSHYKWWDKWCVQLAVDKLYSTVFLFRLSLSFSNLKETFFCIQFSSSVWEFLDPIITTNALFLNNETIQFKGESVIFELHYNTTGYTIHRR